MLALRARRRWQQRLHTVPLRACGDAGCSVSHGSLMRICVSVDLPAVQISALRKSLLSVPLARHHGYDLCGVRGG